MLSWETLQQFGPYAVSLFILGLWLKREIDRADRVIGELSIANKDLQDKLEALAEKGQALAFETNRRVEALQTILTAGGRT